MGVAWWNEKYLSVVVECAAKKKGGRAALDGQPRAAVPTLQSAGN